MRHSLASLIVVVCSIPAILFLSCTNQTVSPYDISKTEITVFAQRSSGTLGFSNIEDTVGNTIIIGARCNWWINVDSVQFRQMISTSTSFKDTVLAVKADVSALKYSDTVWQSAVFEEMGTKTIAAMAFLKNGHVVSDTVIITIYPRPATNHPPVWRKDTINEVGHPGVPITISLSDKCSDPDNDSLNFSLLVGPPTGDAITNPTTVEASFVLSPGQADTGLFYPRIVAKDPKGAADTVTIALSIHALIIDSLSPLITLINPAKDTIIGNDSYMVRVKCMDASGISSVTCTMGAASFPVIKPAITDSIWSATITGLSPGQFSALTIIAVDSSLAANKDTLVLRIKYDNDSIAPIITRFDPAQDSMSVNSNSYAVKVVCKDPSGVASVVYTLGTANFPAIKNSDTIWSAIINGLIPSVFSKIAVVATDGSLRANKDTMTLSIKYDSTITDLTGPIFYQKNGPANNAIVIDSSVIIVDSIYDPSGVDSVYRMLNGKNPKPLTLVSGRTNLYSLTDTLRRFHLDTIVIYAQDKSTNRNKNSQTIALNYNVPPVINDTGVSTNRNTAKTWTLNFQSFDGDPLTWSRLTSPSSLSGTITGTFPSVSFTPAANWAGADSFLVRVTDGYWSDTAKIKFTVIDVPVAPTITTQPASATKNVGQSITFSVGIYADVNPTPTYQWKHNGTAITSANQASFTIGSIAIVDSGSYTVTVTNSAGTVNSSAAILTVNFAPTITTQPVSQVLYLGKSVTFSVVATGSPAPTYIWRKNGGVINGATGASFTINTSGITDSGKYTVTLTNSVGSVISDTAKLYAIFNCISAGGSHSLFLKTDGRLFACGANNLGQLGDNTSTDRSLPVQIMTDVQTISAGASHSLIVTTDGTLFACGFNNTGELGDGTTTDRHSPVKIMTGVQSIAAGSSHSLILKTDGTLFACGFNYWGELGDSTTTDRHFPVQIMSGVQSIAAGVSHSLILKTDGTLYACGANSAGQLGDGTTTDRHSPVQITTGVQSIAAGIGSHSFILTTDGTLFACGYNSAGQLGDGSTDNTSIPKQIRSGVQSMAAGSTHSLILQTNRTLVACGYNGFGQLGDGTTTDRHTPVQIMTGVQSISTGGNHSLILMTDGKLFACGDNTNGELCDGTTTQRLTPVEISF